jgi:hypothetical protein
MDVYSHFMCDFTLYYFEDKRKFFSNCFDGLMPGGTWIIYLDPDKVYPILPPGIPIRSFTSKVCQRIQICLFLGFESEIGRNPKILRLSMESENEIINMVQDS